MAASYKQQKEDFVANLSGGSVAEIASVTSVAPVAVLLWSALQARQSFFRARGRLSYAVDYALNVGAILLATTLYANRPILLDLLLLVPAAVVYVLPRDGPGRRKQQKPRVAGPAEQVDALPMKAFLSTYRGCMMVVTCVAILAVDFRLFPRRFAKVETWGTSLMDVGVGSFVFAGGIVAARSVLKEKLAGRRMMALSARLLHAARHSIPLLMLGVVRLLSVKGLDYAEHVSEYGVHWNFFFTLGLIPPFVAASQAALGIVRSRAVLALLIAAVYQILLESTDLKAYVLTAPRVDLVSKNREGLSSFAGYLAIFLAGQGLGLDIMPRDVGGLGKSSKSRVSHLRVMAAWAGLWTGLYWLSTSYAFGLGLTVSRQLANLPYVLWVAAFNSLQILAFACIDATFFGGAAGGKAGEADAGKEAEAVRWATSRVLRAFNQNGLALFLLANLLTGLVNMTVLTLEATPVATMGILLVYTVTLTVVAVWLDEHHIAIKL